MKLVKINCEIRYLEGIKLLAGYEGIYTDLLKKEPEQVKRWAMPGLRLEDREKKRVILVDPARSVIGIEQPPNVGFCRDLVIQFFGSVNERLGIPQIARYGLRSTWIEKYEGSFQELLSKCKQRIFGNSRLIEKTDDVCAVLNYTVEGGQKLSVTTGPMEVEQLKSQFLTFEPESLPQLFLYVDVDLGDTMTKQYSAQYVRAFFDKAIEEGSRLAKEVITQVGVTQ